MFPFDYACIRSMYQIMHVQDLNSKTSFWRNFECQNIISLNEVRIIKQRLSVNRKTLLSKYPNTASCCLRGRAARPGGLRC
jgi:hypothetical protein